MGWRLHCSGVSLDDTLLCLATALQTPALSQLVHDSRLLHNTPTCSLHWVPAGTSPKQHCSSFCMKGEHSFTVPAAKPCLQLRFLNLRVHPAGFAK